MSIIVPRALFKVGGGTLIQNIQIPKTDGSGTYWPHKVDVYLPAGTIAACTLMLHGGSGSKESFAQANGVSYTSVPTPSTVNWGFLQFWHMALMIPQGQFCDGIVTGPIPVFNPYGVTAQNATTWENLCMHSGVDDLQFCKDAATWFQTTYGIPNVYAYGHSNGGMMVQRLWREASPYFKFFGSMCGPASNTYSTSPVIPGIYRPWIGIYSGGDTVLDILDGPAGPGDHFFDAELIQNPAQYSVADDTYNPNTPPYFFPTKWIGPFTEFAWKVTQASGGAESVDPGAGVVTNIAVGTQTAWSALGGALQLILVADSAHPLSTIQSCLGARPLSVFWQFVINN